jgi:hypothetical protein
MKWRKNPYKNKIKSWFFKNINKIDKLANLTKMKREKTQINKIRGKTW